MDSFKRTLTRLVVVILVLGLLGAVGFLLSELNAKTYTLEDQGGTLVVMKGRELPMGADVFRPSDPALVDAYAALPLDGMPLDPALLQQRFTDRDELDRTLFDVLQKLAGPRVASDDPTALDRGFYYLRRADKLAGITPEQRTQLGRMKADVAFYQGRVKLDEARKTLAEALSQLHIAADSQNKHSRNANQMLLTVEPPTKVLEEALRQAVNTLSAPPSVPQPPTPTPTPAVEAPPTVPPAAPVEPKDDKVKDKKEEPPQPAPKADALEPSR